ncbi:hypothetical protein HDU93_001818 [Gonapodya sp. JEL0774]|nr:hypothetical protein HDU93_001818 [Gonapodya sp. JEL0774]
MGRTQLQQYVEDNLALNSPPGTNEKNAYGGDGPENTAAGLASLVQKFSPSDNIICFIITDADPHYVRNGRSQEAQRESEWLADKGLPTDIFQVLNLVCETLNVTLVPILYTNSNLAWYIQAATLSNGIMLFPSSTDASLLAVGLDALLQALQARVMGGATGVSEQTLNELRGFRVVAPDANSIELLEADTVNLPTLLDHPHSRSDDKRTALGRLLDTATDRFSGKRAGKRVRGVDMDATTASVKYFVISMLESLGRVDLFGEDGALAKDIRDEMKKFVDRTPAVVSPKLLDPPPALSASDVELSEGAVTCVVLLETAMGTIQSLKELPIKTEEDLSKWLSLAMEMLMVRFVDVRFPRDKLNPVLVDFADSWSAKVKSISISSVISALAALEMRATASSEGHLVYQDPLSKKEHSTALIIAHPNDAVLTRAFQVLSGLPTLHGLIQGNLVSGGYQIFPSLSPGLTAASLVHMAYDIAAKGTQDPSEAEWEVMRSLVWSIQKQTMTPASDIVKSLRKGLGFNNPSDAIPKLVAALIVHLHRRKTPAVGSDKALVFELFEEMSAARVATIHNYNNKREADGKLPVYNGWISPIEIGQCFIIDWDFDKLKPLEELHPCEIFASRGKRDGAEAAADGTEATGWEGRLETAVAETKVFLSTFRAHSLLTRVLFGADLKLSDPKVAIPRTVDVALNEGEARSIMVESALLERRSMRFELLNPQETKEANEWRRRAKSEYSLLDMGRTIVADCIASQSKEWWAERSEFARKQLMDRAEQDVIRRVFLANGQTELTEDQELNIVADMRDSLTMNFLGRTFKLTRMDVPDLLRRVPKELMQTVGKLLVIGDWTPMAPAALRRSYAVIVELFASCECRDAVRQALTAAMICKRDTPNRHGHTKELTWPGYLGWSREYEEARLKAVPEGTKDPEKWASNVKKALQYMRMCTEEGAILPQLRRKT